MVCLKLMRRKGVYPYEYMKSWSRFDEVSLPEKSDFYSKLNLSGISDEDYEHAREVWNKLNVKNMGEYHNIYLKTDVLVIS